MKQPLQFNTDLIKETKKSNLKIKKEITSIDELFSEYEKSGFQRDIAFWTVDLEKLRYEKEGGENNFKASTYNKEEKQFQIEYEKYFLTINCEILSNRIKEWYEKNNIEEIENKKIEVNKFLKKNIYDNDLIKICGTYKLIKPLINEMFKDDLIDKEHKSLLEDTLSSTLELKEDLNDFKSGLSGFKKEHEESIQTLKQRNNEKYYEKRRLNEIKNYFKSKKHENIEDKIITLSINFEYNRENELKPISNLNLEKQTYDIDINEFRISIDCQEFSKRIKNWYKENFGIKNSIQNLKLTKRDKEYKTESFLKKNIYNNPIIEAANEYDVLRPLITEMYDAKLIEKQHINKLYKINRQIIIQKNKIRRIDYKNEIFLEK